MTVNLNSPILALAAGQVVSLDDAAGKRISARYGTIWITYEDSRSDVILRTGESLILAKDGRTVLQALQPAFVTLQ
jgi:hypothetical protein